MNEIGQFQFPKKQTLTFQFNESFKKKFISTSVNLFILPEVQ
jgi:hypothetical protein